MRFDLSLEHFKLCPFFTGAAHCEQHFSHSCLSMTLAFKEHGTILRDGRSIYQIQKGPVGPFLKTEVV